MKFDKSLWDNTPAGDERLPAGIYECEAIKGEQFESKNGTPGYKITWKVLIGEHKGRLLWQDLWLTPAAMPMAKRQLKQFNMTSPEDTLPDGIVFRVEVAIKTTDDDRQFNEVKKTEFLRQEVNPFPPKQDEKPNPAAGKIEEPVAPMDEVVALPPKVENISKKKKKADVSISEHAFNVANVIPIMKPISLEDIRAKLPGLHLDHLNKAIGELLQHGLHGMSGGYNLNLYMWLRQPSFVSLNDASKALTEEEFVRGVNDVELPPSPKVEDANE